MKLMMNEEYSQFKTNKNEKDMKVNMNEENIHYHRSGSCHMSVPVIPLY